MESHGDQIKLRTHVKLIFRKKDKYFTKILKAKIKMLKAGIWQKKGEKI